MNPNSLAVLADLSEKIASELVFAEPGTDLGLLPVNSLLSQLEEIVHSEPADEALAAGLLPARRCVENVLETSGTFSAEDIGQLGEWVAWWQAALRAQEDGCPMPPALPVIGAPLGGPQQISAPAQDQPGQSAEEPVLELNLEQDSELLNEFINESQEHLQNIEQGVLGLEENPADADTLNSIFRAFHTFKGGAGFLNLAAIQTLAHELESLLDLARRQELPITPELINLILDGGDTLKRFTAEIRARLEGGQSGPLVVPTLGLLSAIRAALRSAAESGAGRGAEPASPALSDKSIPDLMAPPEAARPAMESAAAASGSGSIAEPVKREARASAAVKVDTQKLDSLVDLVGELVIAQSLVAQNRDLESVQSEQLTRDLAQMGRISKDLQRIVMSLRMVPIRSTFQKMQRLVRDLAGKLGKEVRFVTEGEDTELDRTIVEEISDPLIHMIRNAVDHGLELPSARRERGKPPAGTLSLKAFHQGGNIVIEVKDDGNGLDCEQILAKAVELGLLQPGEHLSDSEVFNLILAPGFSTATKVTDLSGRGVGMDVVRRNIEKLRGKIEIQSTPGQGSTFGIYLPLTLAIIDGLLVGVGEHRYILPTLLVRESFRPAAEAIHTVYGQGEMINVRGRLRPLLRLSDHLGIEPASTDAAESIVLVVEAGSHTRCVLVDRLLGKQEVVIKSLGETFQQSRCISGAGILGDGRVGLILDPQALVHLNSAPIEAAA